MIRWKPLTGDEWEWGSPKTLGLLVFLCGLLFIWVFPTVLLVLYSFCRGCLWFIGVWKLAYRLTARRDLAWFAMLMLNLSGVINFDIIPYNDNYILVTFGLG